MPSGQSTDAEVEEYRRTAQAPNPYLFLVALDTFGTSAARGTFRDAAL